MKVSGRLGACVPYAIVLLATAFLWWQAGTITYDARPGQLGPEFWPRVAISVMAIAALIEIARALFTGHSGAGASGIGEVLEATDEEEGLEPRRTGLLLGGAALTLGFAVLVTTLGFILSTFIYLVVFMYLGQYRNNTVIWASSIIGTLVLALIFLKVVYVSLPRGVPPFDKVTQAVINGLSLF